MSSLSLPSKARRSLTHVLLAGVNPLSPPPRRTSSLHRQSPSNPFLTPVPFSNWLGSIGRAADVLAGWSILPNSLHSGLAHSLIGYESDGVHRVFATGRNEMGQLGVAYNSQEGTRGLVEGFKGDGIVSLKAGSQSSYMMVREGGASSISRTLRLGWKLTTESERQHESLGIWQLTARPLGAPRSRGAGHVS